MNGVMLYIILMCISCFMFFADELLLAAYLISILDQGNDFRPKANLSNFLIQVQDCKAAETTCSINNIFCPGIANEHRVQWWLKKFCKGDERFEDQECSGQPSEVDSNQLRAIIEVDPLTSAQEIAKELKADHSTMSYI